MGVPQINFQVEQVVQVVGSRLKLLSKIRYVDDLVDSAYLLTV
ncbi:MAG: hypothetical protein ACTS2F_05140 [Thainema sp.]